MSARPRCSARPNSPLRLAVPCSSSSEHAEGGKTSGGNLTVPPFSLRAVPAAWGSLARRGAGRNRTDEQRFCRPLPYHLATAPRDVNWQSTWTFSTHPRKFFRPLLNLCRAARGESRTVEIAGLPSLPDRVADWSSAGPVAPQRSNHVVLQRAFFL